LPAAVIINYQFRYFAGSIKGGRTLKNYPVAFKIALAYLPAAALIIVFSRLPWWVNLLLAVASLMAAFLLWVLLFDHQVRPAAEAGIDPGLLDTELKKVLLETASTGSAVFLSARSLMRRGALLSESLTELNRSLADLAGGDRQTESDLQAIAAMLKSVESRAEEMVQAGENYLVYMKQIELLAEQGQEILDQTGAMERESAEALEATATAAEELTRFEENIFSVIETFRDFGRQVNSLAMNSSLRANRTEGQASGLQVMAEEIATLANFSCRGVDRVGVLDAEARALLIGLKERIGCAGQALSLQDMQISALRDALDRFIQATGETATHFVPVQETARDLNDGLNNFMAETGSLALSHDQSATLFSQIGCAATAQREVTGELVKSTADLVARVDEFRQKAGRYDLPTLGYINRPEDLAGAYLFKHWYKRDCKAEVCLVEVEEPAAAELIEALAAGQFDTSISLRTPGIHEALIASHRDSLDLLGTNLAGSRSGLLVPDYVDIGTIGVLRHKSAQFGGVIYAAGEKKGLCQQVREAESEYKLGMQIKYVDTVELAKIIGKALAENSWIVFSGWIPEPLFMQSSLKFLSDPKNCFGGEQFIRTVARAGLKENNPRFHRALRMFRWGVEDASEFLSYLNDGLTLDEAAEKILGRIEATLL
jgi:ABC-type proline/glycine betaine transport system substrate-binding protein/methyl-accepting chemotaxis protein